MGETKGGLRRELGLAPAVLSGTGVIVGAGVYTLIGEAAGLAGGATWLAFLVAALVAGLTAASYARMGRRIPKDSPEFQYTRVGLGPRAGFLAGWLMIGADLVATAAVALGFGAYLEFLFGVPLVIGALALAAVLSVVAWSGIRESVILVSLLSLTEIAGLVVVVVVGVPHWGEHSLTEAPQGLTGVWTASALIFFAYIGFDELGNLAEEMREPERNLRRAIVLSMAVSTVLYVLVAVSSVSLLGASALAGSQAPLAEAVERVLGPGGRVGLAFVALAATANTVLLLMIAASRSLYGMARAGALPAVLRTIGRRRTPWIGTAFVWLAVSAFLFIGDIGIVAQVANFATLASFALVNLGLAFVLRREARDRRAKGSAVRWLGYAQPVGAFVACAVLASQTGWIAIGFGTVVGVVGLAVHRVLERRSGT